MKPIDIEWVKQQLTAGRVTQPVGTAVMRLFEVWNTMNHTDKSAQDTIDVFSRLAVGVALVAETPDGETGYWTPASPGGISMADVVRVRVDAFQGDLGVIHNGRIGRVVGIRSGDIIVKTTDDRPVLEGAHYSPHHLEKWIRT